MNVEIVKSVCEITHRLHPMSESAISALINGSIERISFIRSFTLPQSVNFEHVECIWNLVKATVGA